MTLVYEHHVCKYLASVHAKVCRSLLRFQRLCNTRNHPFTGEILTNSREQSIVSHRIEIVQAVISAASAYHKPAGTSEANTSVELIPAYFSIHGGVILWSPFEMLRRAFRFHIRR
jgi:hypothetical protein